MRNKTRKLISTLLTLAMLVSLITVMPLTASAAGNTIYLVPDGDASIDGSTIFGVSDYASAIAALDTSGDTLDISGAPENFSNILPMYTLEFGSKAVTVKGDSTKTYSNLRITTGADLTLEDYKTDYSAGNPDAILFYVYGSAGDYTLTINGDCEITGKSGMSAIRSAGDLTIDVSGGASFAATSSQYTVRGYASGGLYYDITINGGTISATGNTTNIAIECNNANISGTAQVAATGTGTAIDAAGKVTLAGGTVTATTGSAIVANEIEVTGTATVSNDGPAPAIPVGEGGLYTETAAGNLTVTGDVKVNGGSVGISADTGKITIYGDVSVYGSASDDSVVVTKNSGIVTVIGDVEFTGAGVKWIAAYTGGEVYITGEIAGRPQIWIGGSGLASTPTLTDEQISGDPYDKYLWDVYTYTAILQSYVYLASKAKNIIDLDEPWFSDTSDYDICLPCWEWEESSNTLTVKDDVSIVGTFENANRTLNIDIAAGKTVTWTADYSGNTSGAYYLIDFTVGVGSTFEMTGGSIVQTGNSAALWGGNYTISGGMVSAESGSAIVGGVTISGATTVIKNNSSPNPAILGVNNTVTVTSGTVINNGNGPAISVSTGTVNVSGGTVSAGNGNAINATGATSNVNISGGTVEATGTGTAINSAGKVTLDGGTVTANTGTAIDADEIEVTGTVTVENSESATDPAIRVGDGGLYTKIAAGDLTVNGDVTSTGSSYGEIWAQSGKITINGDVALSGADNYVGAVYSGAVTINGDIGFSGTGDKELYAHTGGKTYVTGTATSLAEITVDSETFVPPFVPTTANGLVYDGYYWDVYTDTAFTPRSYVYIRQEEAPIPVISTAAGALANGTVGTAYSVTLAATNSPTSWTVSTGTLPAGLTISNAGVISGTPTAAGTSNFSITATNSNGDSAPVAYSITISAASPSTPSGGGGGGGAAPTYTVTFNTNGGSAVASGKGAANGKLAKPADPTREGYDFAGWYTNAGLTTPYDFNSNVTEGFTLYAKLTEKGPTPVTPEMPVNPFTDVKGTDWFIDDVIYAYDKGLIDGTSPTTFSPNSNLTYAQAITLAARMHQLYTKGEITLENGDDPWYQSYVDYAIENGIISGDYDWGAMATRAGYMQIFANALPNDAFAAINSVPDGSIPDVPVDYPGAAAIYKLYRAGILQGNDDAHTFLPEANIRRSEVAAILTRMMNPEVRIEFSI